MLLSMVLGSLSRYKSTPEFGLSHPGGFFFLGRPINRTQSGVSIHGSLIVGSLPGLNTYFYLLCVISGFPGIDYLLFLA